MQEKKVFVSTPEETERIAHEMGENLRGGECIELVSDLGGGKTTFTRGFVRGMGSLDAVTSPTFTIGKQYTSGDMTCYHFDFYRLQEPGLVAEELAEAVSDPKGVIVVEWAESVSDVLPENRIIIELLKNAESSESRKIIIKYPEVMNHIVEGIV